MSKFVILFLLLSQPVWAETENLHGLYFYKLFQKHFFDVDSYLESGPVGLQAVRCHYKSYVSHQEGDFQGLGACLYQSVVDGMSTDRVPGSITAHMKVISTNENLIVGVGWRPPKGGFFHLLEKVYRDWKRKPDVGEKDTLLGTLAFDFSASEPKAVKSALKPLDPYLPTLLSAPDEDLAQVRLSAHPRVGDERITDTLVEFYSRSQKQMTKVYWDWNFFVIPPPKNKKEVVTLQAGTIP